MTGSIPEFEADLADRLRAAADPVAADGVTRSGVAAAAERHRRRQRRDRGLLLGVAAAILLVAGLLAILRPGADGSEQLRFEDPPATVTPCPTASGSTTPAGWLRLSADQAAVLRSAGAITAEEAAAVGQHAVLLSQADLTVLSDADVGPVAAQLQDLGYEDSAGIARLRADGVLTADQEAQIAAGIAPVLDRDQVDRLFAAFPDLQAVAAGGQPFPTGGVDFVPSAGAEVGGAPGPTSASAGCRNVTTSGG